MRIIPAAPPETRIMPSVCQPVRISLYNTQAKIAAQFSELKIAFINSDETIARKILENYLPIKEECNKMLKELFLEELSTQEAITTALLSRYLKRINSHISNIASGIVYPLEQIDFIRVKGGLLE